MIHILSLYPAHRSALTDRGKLLDSGFTRKKAIVSYRVDYLDWPMDPTIKAFEMLAANSI